MVHGYHVILTAYGVWLPNDPRGSWSEFVGKWELVRFGHATKGREFRHLDELAAQEVRQRELARQSLKYPAVQFSAEQIQSIARGFTSACTEYGYRIWACSILPEHTHLVVARHRYKIEYVNNKLKASTSGQLRDDSLHPMTRFAKPGSRPPRMWSEHEWKSFLDSGRAIEDAMNYVVENPLKEGLPQQTWDFVTPFAGLEAGWVTYMD